MAQKVTLNPGDEVYLEDGRIAGFVASAPDGFIVRPIIESDEGGWPGKPILVARVSREEPADKISPVIAELRTAEADLRAKVFALRAEAMDLERAQLDRRAHIAQHGHLETLDNFLSGKITHAVTREYDDKFYVQDLSEAAQDERSYSSLRLISLVGSLRGGTLTSWSIEGRSGHFVPATSREAAVAIAASQIEKEFSDHRAGRRVNVVNLVASCKRIGLPIPADMAAIVAAAAHEAAANAVRKAEQSLEVARAQLAAVAKPEAV
jgi:hypothetical protein